MNTYLTLSVGAHPHDARPVFASDDPEIVDAVMHAVLIRVGVSPFLQVITKDDPARTVRRRKDDRKEESE